MGRTEINEEEERFQVGPHNEQRFRVRIEPGVFTKVLRVRERRQALGFVSVEK